MSINLDTCPLEDYHPMVQEALAILRDDGQTRWKRSDAESLIHEASLQALPVVHRYLDEIYELTLKPDTMDEEHFPWRESGLLHFDFLKRVILDESRPNKERKSAWIKLMETRHPDALLFAESVAHDLEFSFEIYLEWFGYHKQGNVIKPLYTEQPFHIRFSAQYLAQTHQHLADLPSHPTWYLPITDETPQRFGGICDAACAVCGGRLHHLITLNPIPKALNLSSLSSLTLAVCLSCLGWNWETYKYLFYEHDADGHPTSIGYDGQRIKPEFPAPALQETVVHLSDGGARWRWQTWSDGNLHRVGGFPAWVQDSDYPRCIRCHQPMRFLIQLDSDIPTQNGENWMWGTGGLGYGMWCNECHISAYLMQWT